MIQNPSNLYAGNAVVLNSNPSVNFMTHLLAEKQAKEDALNKFNADQMAKINPQGMRQQEVPALLAAKDDLQNYYTANSDAINHPTAKNLLPYQTYQQKMNLANQIISASKGAAAKTTDINKVQGDPNKIGLVPQSSLGAFDRQAAPAYIVKNGKVVPNDYDPTSNPNGYQDFDMNYHFNPKPKTANELENLYQSYGKGLIPSVYDISNAPVINPDGTKSKYSFIQTTKQTFAPDQLKQIGVTAKQAFNNDNGLSSTFIKNNKFDPDNPEDVKNLNQLNGFYKQTTGNDIHDESDLYAAGIMARKAAESKISTKNIKDEDAEKQFQMDKMYTSHNLAQQNIRLSAGLRKEAKNDDDVSGVDAVLSDIKDNMNNGVSSTTLPNWMKGANPALGDKIPVTDPAMLKAFSEKIGTNTVQPSAISYDPTSKRFNVHFDPINYTDDKDQPQVIPAKDVALSESDYLNKKVKETYGVGKMGNKLNIISGLMQKNGGLVNTINNIYGGKQLPQTPSAVSQPQSSDGIIRIKLANGQTATGKKSDLKNLDSKGIKYTIIK